MTDAVFDACMSRICNGDKNALHEIYEEYLPYIYSVVLTIVGSKENAEDITSDFFIKLWTGSDKYKPGTGHKGYMATIARNMAIDFLRKHKNETLISEFEQTGDEDAADLSTAATMQLAENSVTPEDEVIDDMALADALNTLKPAEREVINLKIMGDMAFREIADILGKPMGTVTWLYREAINKLRRYGYE